MSEEIEVDPPLTIEQEKLVDMLRSADLETIDNALLQNVSDIWRKVARVVGTTMIGFEERFKGVPDVFFAQRIQQLAEKGLLESQGNLKHMRYSEIRFPQNETEQKS